MEEEDVVVCDQCHRKINQSMAKMCARCKTVFCSEKCMKASWELGSHHRESCVKIAEALKQYEKALFDAISELAGIQGVGSSKEEEIKGEPPSKRRKIGQDVADARKQLEDAIVGETTTTTTTAANIETNVALSQAAIEVAKTVSPEMLDAALKIAFNTGEDKKYTMWLGPIVMAMPFARRQELSPKAVTDLFHQVKSEIEKLGTKPTSETLWKFSDEYRLVLKSIPKRDRKMLRFSGKIPHHSRYYNYISGKNEIDTYRDIIKTLTLIDLSGSKAIVNVDHENIQMTAVFEFVEVLAKAGCRNFSLVGVEDMATDENSPFVEEGWRLLTDVVPIGVECDVKCCTGFWIAFAMLMFSNVRRLKLILASEDHYNKRENFVGSWTRAAIRRCGARIVDINLTSLHEGAKTQHEAAIEFLNDVNENWMFWKKYIRNLDINTDTGVSIYRGGLPFIDEFDPENFMDVLYERVAPNVTRYGKIEVENFTPYGTQIDDTKMQKIIDAMFFIKQ